MKKLAALCKIEFILFTRDFFSFFFSLVFPVLMLLLFGGIYGNEPVYSGADIKMMDVCVPAYSVMIIGVTGLMSLPLSLSGYKEKKIYKRFDASPAGKKAVISAQITVNFIMTLIGISVLLVFGKLIYNIQIKGSFFPICTGLIISIAAMFSMGFLFTAIGRDLKSTSLLCNLFYFIMLFLSGATVPDMLFPEKIKNIAAFLPMTYAVDLMQGLFAGEGLGMHIKEMLILGFAAVIFSFVGAFLYRNKDWT